MGNIKDTFFFPHDFGARNDPKLLSLMATHGVAGIGVFWCVIEQIYEQGGALPLSSCKLIAFALHVDGNVVEDVILNHGLFQNDGEMFWSESVNNRLDRRKDIAEKRKAAAEKRWKSATQKDDECKSNANAQNNDANAMQDYAIKEKKRKEKERKEKKTSPSEKESVRGKGGLLKKITSKEADHLRERLKAVDWFDSITEDFMRLADYGQQPEGLAIRLLTEYEKALKQPYRGVEILKPHNIIAALREAEASGEIVCPGWRQVRIYDRMKQVCKEETIRSVFRWMDDAKDDEERSDRETDMLSRLSEIGNGKIKLPDNYVMAALKQSP